MTEEIDRRLSDRMSDIKYSKLQRLAKHVGIKANQKQSKLVDALAAFFQDRSKDNEAIERELMALEGEQSSEDETPAEVETIASRSGAQKGRRSTVGSARKRRRRTVLNDSTGLLATSLEENPDVASAQRKSPRLSTLIKFSPSAEGIEDSAERRKRVIMEEIRDRIKQKGIGDEEKSAEGDSEEEYHVAPVSASKDWGKIHGKEFNKMESIDDYLTKKRQRQEELTKMMEQTKLAAAKSREMIHRAYASRTPTLKSRNSAVVKVTTGPSSGFKPFVPSVLTPSQLNFNFGGLSTNMKSTPIPRGLQKNATSALKDQSSTVNTKKTSTTKKPRLNTPVENKNVSGTYDVIPKVDLPKSAKTASANKPSIKSSIASSSGKRVAEAQQKKVTVAAAAIKADLQSKLRTPPVLRSKLIKPGPLALAKLPSHNKPVVIVNKSSETTKLNPTVNNKKMVNRFGFDLEASLKRKLNYKPYTGPLKPLSVSAASREAYKNPKSSKIKVAATRDNLRNQLASNRADKRRQTLMQRRGLVELQ